MTAETSHAGGGAAIHASAVVLGEGAVLIRGEPGAGKSTLARELLREAAARSLFARLLADDRVLIKARHGRLIARAHPVTAGLIEARGAGLMRVPHEAAAVVRLVVDVTRESDRLPDLATTRLCGIDLPVLTGAGGPGLAAALVGGWDGVGWRSVEA